MPAAAPCITHLPSRSARVQTGANRPVRPNGPTARRHHLLWSRQRDMAESDRSWRASLGHSCFISQDRQTKKDARPQSEFVYVLCYKPCPGLHTPFIRASHTSCLEVLPAGPYGPHAAGGRSAGRHAPNVRSESTRFPPIVKWN